MITSKKIYIIHKYISVLFNKQVLLSIVTNAATTSHIVWVEKKHESNHFVL